MAAHVGVAHVGLAQGVSHGDGGGPVKLLGGDQGLAQDVHILGMLLGLSGEAGHMSAQYIAPSTWPTL